MHQIDITSFFAPSQFNRLVATPTQVDSPGVAMGTLVPVNPLMTMVPAHLPTIPDTGQAAIVGVNTAITGESPNLTVKVNGTIVSV